MTLAHQQLSSLIFHSEEGNEILQQINNLFAKLIDNNVSMTTESQVAPTLWECKWLNDDSVDGYQRGDAVWMNSTNIAQLLASQYSTVSGYIADNPTLEKLFQQVNPDDQTAVNNFMLSAIDGTASPLVSSIYCLGTLTDPVQIRISKLDNNKQYPTTSAWEDFYLSNTREDNIKMMMDSLSSILDRRVDQHLSSYHPSGVSEEQLKALGFFKHNPSEISAVQKQHFYDHTYCTFMEGFDYVVDWKVVGNSWYRQWNSGYLEQGGFVNNSSSRLIEVTFQKSYNYPVGASFYQEQYSTIEGHSIVGNLPAAKRYVVSVTPVLKPNADCPFKKTATKIGGEAVYSSNDVTKLSNIGFSIVNVDTSMDTYSKYSWFVAGYVSSAVS